MSDGFICGDWYARVVRIYQPASFYYAGLRAKDMARRCGYSFALLRHGSPGSSPVHGRIDKRTPRTAYCSTHVFHFTVVCDPRQLACSSCDGDSSGVESANHESSVGKYCSARRDSIPLFDQFRAFVDHAEDSMAKCSL